jgi:hypothetical protein
MADRAVVASTADITSVASTSSRLSEAPPDSDSSDVAWIAPHRFSISATESRWSSQLHSVELAGVSRRDGCRAAHLRGTSGPPASSRSPHLHHTPLLI